MTITVDDGEFTDEATLTVTVDNTVNEAPDLAVNQANISETGAVNSAVYTVSELILCPRLNVLLHKSDSNQGSDYIASDYVILFLEFRLFCGINPLIGKKQLCL